MKKLTSTLIASAALAGAASVHAAGLDGQPTQGQLVAQASTGAQEGTQSRGNLDYKPGGTGAPTTQSREEVVQDRDAAKATGDQQQQGELTKPTEREEMTTESREGVAAERDAAQSSGKTSKGELDYPKKAQ